MNVTILVPGRWHAFDLARELHARDSLELLVTSYPKCKTRKWGIPDEKVRSLFWHQVLCRAVWESGGDALDIRLGHVLFPLFGRAASRYARGRKVLHAWAGAGLESLRLPWESHPVRMVDRASAHRIEQDTILAAEHQRRGKSTTVRPQKMVQRELREYDLSDGVIVPSLFVERSFLRQGFPAGKLHRSCLGVDPRAFPKIQKLDPGAFQAIYVGSLSLRKGIPYLLEAFQMARMPGAELRMVGGREQDWKELALRPPPGVRWFPHQPQAQLAEHYRKASVFVMASLEEGQAMVQLQALACGLPLICTRHTGGEDLLELSGCGVDGAGGITEFPAGYVVPAGDAPSLARCLEFLFQNPALLKEKQAAAARIPIEHFSWGAYAERNLGIYEKLLSQKQNAWRTPQATPG